jgi:protein O-GlcNAc transferase
LAEFSEILAQAIACHRAGQLDRAAQIYGQILEADANHADALHLLGVIAHQWGQHGAAIEHIERAIRLKGNQAAFHNNLAEAYRALGKSANAIASYQRALQLKPDYAEAHNNLATAFQALGRIPEAIASYQRALELKPDYADAHNNLGTALHAQGKAAEAITCYQRALQLRPDYVQAHNNLGIAFVTQGEIARALACYQQALQLNPDYAEGHSNLGIALQKRGQIAEAILCCRRALQLKPDFVEAYNNLGNVLRDQGRLDEAIASYQRALGLKPDYPEAHYNLGNALADQGRLTAAIDNYHRALQLRPDYAEAENNLGNALKDCGRLDEAIICYRQASPRFGPAQDNALFALQYRDGITLSELAEAHAGYEQQRATPLRATWRPYNNTPNPERPLRLGFLSADFRSHPVGNFLIRALENLDRRQFVAVCYCDQMTPDALTSRFRTVATGWRDATGQTDEQLADQIRADSIDILFDLAGHTAGNRLLVFARRPAPLQIAWIGYEGTTGLAAMDYLLADHYAIPRSAETFYCEKVLRLPDSYVCYDPPHGAPKVSPLPVLESGCFRFGCCNNPAKLTRRVVETWSRILRRLPDSRLVLKYKGMSDPGVVGQFAEHFAAHGVDAAQLDFRGRSPYAEYLASYGQIDLALDPFPFSGGATTCEALWMGVPVVTCPGETFASRHSLSYLSTVGLTETIAGSLDEYVDLAVALANDRPRLAAIRSGLREQMAASALCDGTRFAANLMALLRQVWQRWTDGA